ncbi:MAG: hypothetical protein IKW21_06630 [Lachnospiraceae bacterium]|nr:hypothetical protein [Lachnospiraceae bacterium]
MKNRRIRIEWLKASIAFVVMIISIASVDSDMYIVPMISAVLSLLYLRLTASRLEKRGAF